MKPTEEFNLFTEELMEFSSLGIRPGLERVSRLLFALGSPEKKFVAVQVLGTNGKGSTSSIIESILRASGLKTALYTSPHLVSLSERLHIDGSPLPIERWRRAFEDLKIAVKADDYLSQSIPTFFENLTALCFLMISRESVDIAVLEAGMGGRYDATSSCDSIATVITPIAMDHMEYLGDSLAQIASEKFAAIRSSAPAFYAGDDEALVKQFQNECKVKNAACSLLDDEAKTSEISSDLGGTSFLYESGEYKNRFAIPLVGIHQAENAARAVTAIRMLRKSIPLFSRVSDRHITRGLSSVVWPGRFEVRHGWQGAKALVMDGAHNQHGTSALVQTVESMISRHVFSGVSSVVYAAMKDKDITQMLLDIKMLGCPILCTTVPMERAMPAEELADLSGKFGLDVGGAFENPLDALEEAAGSTSPDKITLCTGSLYFIGFIESKIDDQ